MRQVVDEIHPDADRIVLVMDNLNAHKKALLYDAFEPAQAKRIADKLEIRHTAKHGSWVNMAEIEISVLSRQCLAERMANMYSGKGCFCFQKNCEVDLSNSRWPNTLFTR